jgi:phosphoglycolate phosphatase
MTGRPLAGVAVVFDLDGTLVDSAPDLHAAAAVLLAEEGRPPLDLPTVRSFIGHGVPALVGRVMAARELAEADRARLTGRFSALYDATPARLTRAFPGAVEAVAALAAGGARLGLCTNKPMLPARRILEALGFAPHLSAVIAGDSLPVRKPDPAPLRAAFEALGAGGCRLYVGDSGIDAETAAQAGVPFALFLGGYDAGETSGQGAAARFDHFADLPALVAAWAAARAGAA